MEIRHDLTEQEISDFFMSDPRLAYLSLSDEDLHFMYNNKAYKVKENSAYGGVYENDKLILVFKWELFTSITITFHMYLLYDLHSTGVLSKIKDKLIDFFRESTSFQKALVPIPSCCTHVIKASEKMGFVHEATIKDSATWRKELVDILYYSIKLK